MKKFVSFLLLIINSLLSPLTFMLIFNWFAVPVFHTKPIGYFMAAGLMLVVDFLIIKKNDILSEIIINSDDETSQAVDIVYPIVTIFINIFFIIVGFVLSMLV